MNIFLASMTDGRTNALHILLPPHSSSEMDAELGSLSAGPEGSSCGRASPAATAAASEGSASCTGSWGHRVLLQQPITTSFPARASQGPGREGEGLGGLRDPAHHTWLHRAMPSCSSALPCPQQEGTSLVPTPASTPSLLDGDSP